MLALNNKLFDFDRFFIRIFGMSDYDYGDYDTGEMPRCEPANGVPHTAYTDELLRQQGSNSI